MVPMTYHEELFINDFLHFDFPSYKSFMNIMSQNSYCNMVERVFIHVWSFEGVEMRD